MKLHYLIICMAMFLVQVCALDTISIIPLAKDTERFHVTKNEKYATVLYATARNGGEAFVFSSFHVGAGGILFLTHGYIFRKSTLSSTMVDQEITWRVPIEMWNKLDALESVGVAGPDHVTLTDEQIEAMKLKWK